MTVYSYARVSTIEQAAPDKASIAEQQRITNGWAQAQGHPPPVAFVDEGVSAAIPFDERPQGSALSAALEEGDTLVVAKLDRIFRSALDALSTAEAFKKRKIKLVLYDMGNDPVTDNGISRLFFTIMAAVAELERTTIAERLSMGKRGKRARGGHAGGLAPYGWRTVGSGRDAKLEINEAEQETIAGIRRKRAEGLSPIEIERALRAVNVRTRRGTYFTTVQIKRILDRAPDLSTP